MAKRYEWSPQHWEQLKDSRPGKGTDRGRTAVDNRRFVNGGLWVLRSGARWCALPARSGHWKRIQKRLTRGARAGVWARVFAPLTAARHNASLMLDRTSGRAHQQAVTGKGGPHGRLWGGPEAD